MFQCACTMYYMCSEVLHGEITTESWPPASLPLWRLPRSVAHARLRQFSHSVGTCPDQCSFWWPWQGRQWVMFCLTLQGEVLEPDGCISSSYLGVNECPTQAVPISVDPLGERPTLVEAAPEVWFDRRTSVCAEPYYRHCHHPRKLNSLQCRIHSCKGYSWIKIVLDESRQIFPSNKRAEGITKLTCVVML